MRRVLAVILSFMTLAAAGQDSARGAPISDKSSAGTGNTYAIIIGISGYKNLRSLQYADKDAEAFDHFLRSKAGGSVQADHIETFLNSSAVRANVGDAISDFVRKVKAGDRLYFFFAGHGDMEDLTQVENGLLLLYNSPNGNYFGMNDDVLEILELKRYLSPLTERGVEVCFIVDACHAGNLKGTLQGEVQTATALAASWGKEYKILSCQPSQLSYEGKEYGGGRGLFSLELEEGLRGLADRNNDGTVTLFELQQFLTDKVYSLSDERQIPMVIGDLSRPIATVDPADLAALKKQLAQNYPTLALTTTKGGSEPDSLDPIRRRLHRSFEENITARKLISPADTNAIADYRAFERLAPEHPMVKNMRRELAVALNENFNAIVDPLLKGQTSYSTRDTCHRVAVELDSCLHLLGEKHYMYTNIKARKLFMNAMALTWAINDNEYNIYLKPRVDSSIAFLEESERLEPNAAYTPQQLGKLYFYLDEFEKADRQFQLYIDLRPGDYYARYSLAFLYSKLRQYDKAEPYLEGLVRQYPQQEGPWVLLSDVYFLDNKRAQALACARQFAATDSLRYRGLYQVGFYYTRIRKVDSAAFYYAMARDTSNRALCNNIDNNIALGYMLTGNFDSAEFYFGKLLAADTTFAFSNFNLGTIEGLKGRYRRAGALFFRSLNYSANYLTGVIPNMEVYFNKKYDVLDSAAYVEFKNRSFEFNMQYISAVSILYCYLRDPQLFTMTDKIDLIFSFLKNYHEYDPWTYYHLACCKALQKDTAGALYNLRQSLTLGFGNYFLLTSDHDLALVRETAEFHALLRQFFPDKVKRR